MRSFIFGIVIVLAVPAYVGGQQRGRSGRSETGRTAEPREASAQADRDRQADRRAEPRGETRAQSPREEKSDGAAASGAAPSRAGRERRDTPRVETEGQPLRVQRLQAAPARTRWTNAPRIPPNPNLIPPRKHDGPFPGREHPRPGYNDGDYRRPYRRPHSGANVVFVPYAVPTVVEREVVIEREVLDEPAPVILEQSLARLILDVHPPTAQVFADGYYIGIPEDFRFEDGGAVLEPGPHRIDIIARDYEPVSFDVNLARGQSATFRRSLTPIQRSPQPVTDAAAKAQAAPKQPVTFYLIPGCYMGNVPPKDANLPATCDIARVVSFQY
jgi:hypothetical protein